MTRLSKRLKKAHWRTLSEKYGTTSAGGITATDTPGYPVTIDRSGSYRLTGNPALPDLDTTAIESPLQVSDIGVVTLDLNGFSIKGPNSCTGPPAVCSTGIGLGIDSPFDTVHVRNGGVSGVGGVCLRVGTRSLVEGVHVQNCGSDGIQARSESVISKSRVELAGDDGIEAFGSAAIRVQDSTVRGSTNHGIHNCSGCVITGTVVKNNGMDGISNARNSVVEGCMASSNGRYGIEMSLGSIAKTNTVKDNTDRGLRIVCTSQGCIYAGNVLVGNNEGGAQAATSNALQDGVNVCRTSACP